MNYYDKAHKQWIEQAKAEACRNLKGEDLEKCLIALDNWGKNYCYDKKTHLLTRRTHE